MKKLISACMALAAFAAFALPATASATNDPTLTDPAGHVKVGSLIKGTGTNTEFQTTAGSALVTCSHAEFTGSVTRNDSGFVEGEITKYTFSGTGATHPDTNDLECTGSFGNAGITITNTPLCIRSTPTMTTDTFTVKGGGCKKNESVTFAILSTTAGTCEYTTTPSAITGTYSTSPSTATLTVDNTQNGSGSERHSGGFLCPSSGKLKMSFALTTDTNGEAISIS